MSFKIMLGKLLLVSIIIEIFNAYGIATQDSDDPCPSVLKGEVSPALVTEMFKISEEHFGALLQETNLLKKEYREVLKKSANSYLSSMYSTQARFNKIFGIKDEEDEEDESVEENLSDDKRALLDSYFAEACKCAKVVISMKRSVRRILDNGGRQADQVKQEKQLEESKRLPSAPTAGLGYQ